jgi:hypothetical protein
MMLGVANLRCHQLDSVSVLQAEPRHHHMLSVN